MLPLLVAYGVLALLVGSFLNVCIYRIPSMMPVRVIPVRDSFQLT